VRAALFVVMLVGALVRPALAADCGAPAACVDAEPLWLSPAAARFATISDVAAPDASKLGLSLTGGFRLRPAVVTVPAPNRDGRDVNLMRHASDASLGLRWGLGNRLELTVLVPAGLYQRGAGIKGVTDQAAPAIPTTTLRDPRLGFGFALLGNERLGAKLRFEAKLPLGNSSALGGEQSLVASPSLALGTSWGGFFGGAELGARLRRPATLFGARIGSQARLAAGIGYELRGPRLSLSGELYLLPSLVGSGKPRQLPAEWLATLSWAPRGLRRVSFGLGAGSGLPVSGDGTSAFGVPSFRGLAFVRLSPAE
jgi:hypothetical protein